MPLTNELIAAALASTQTAFESIDQMSDDKWITFVTVVEDAPVQVLGRLGSDGKWYLGVCMVAKPDHDGPPNINKSDVLTLCTEPVAEAIIRAAICLILAGIVFPEDTHAEMRRHFMRRLQSSRFALNPN